MFKRRKLLIVIPKSFSWLTLESLEPFLIYFVWWLLFPICKTAFININFICHISDQLTKVSKLDCSLFSGRSYFTRDFRISYRRKILISYRWGLHRYQWHILENGTNYLTCGTPLTSSCQQDDLPFIITHYFLSESQSSCHLRVFPSYAVWF